MACLGACKTSISAPAGQHLNSLYRGLTGFSPVYISAPRSSPKVAPLKWFWCEHRGWKVHSRDRGGSQEPPSVRSDSQVNQRSRLLAVLLQHGDQRSCSCSCSQRTYLWNSWVPFIPVASQNPARDSQYPRAGFTEAPDLKP